MNQPMIELDSITRTYRVGEAMLTVLDNVSLRIDTGEFVAIMGPSGSGKSTLMHIMGCLDLPTHGHYRLAGEEVTTRRLPDLAPIRNQEIGFVFQNFNLLPKLTALQNVELPMMYAGLSRRERRQRGMELLAQVNLQERHDHLPNALSGGQKQRVAIARALANQPELLLADEPTGALDTSTGQEILALFQELNRAGMTIVLITHDVQVAAFGQRTIRVVDGRVLEDNRDEHD